jgi:sugar phosphate isomerase/epimerase
MQTPSRRDFFRHSATLAAASAFGSVLTPSLGTSFFGALPQTASLLAADAPANASANVPAAKFKLGLCTYQWGKDWDLPTVIANCEKSKVLGVELRIEHKHNVKPSMTAKERQEVKKRFADSQVTFVGMGTNQCYDSPDPEKLKKSIEDTRAYLQLSADCGGSGVKVKPNDFQKDVAHEKTIEQIGRSLNIVGKMAADLGQQIRLEVHGTCCELPTMKQIIDYVDQPNVGLCWNCNKADLNGDGLEANFNLIKNRLGATCHVRDLTIGDYPYQELFNLLVKANFTGWMLLECGEAGKGSVPAMVEQRELFEKMLAKALAGA